VGSTISREDRRSTRGPGTTDDFEALVSSFIETTVADNEHPRAALISKGGVVRSENGATERIGSPAVVVVTNARLLFITPDENMEMQEWSAYYSDLAEVSIEREAANRVEVSTCEGVGWRCTLPNANPEVLDAVTRHLRWVGRVRAQVLALEERVDEAAEDIREHAANMDWDAAHEVYQAVREKLDTLVTNVQLTTPMADDTLAPELTDIERTLEEANVRLYIERASSQLELGRYLVEHEDYDRAADVLARARQLHQQADGQSDAVKRPDAFAFGRQRDLTEDIERLEWELQAVAAEPVRQAQEASIKADETDDPDAAVEYWETAVRRYDRILDLDWWKQAQEAAEDVDDARGERDRAVRQLVETRTEIAGERWREGVRSHERGDTAGALERLETALSHLDRAHELAVEFDHDDADGLSAHLSEVRSAIDTLQEDPVRRSGSSDEDSLTDVTPPDAAGVEHEDTDPQESVEGPRTDEPDAGETDGEDDGTVEAGPDSGPTVEPGPDGGSEPQTAGAGGDESTPEAAMVRIQQETFTADTRETDEWIPPSMSDIVAIETHHELTYDLEKIGLPEDVSAEDEDETGH
jgi:tetratricopeptide (TPR) repeat protein